MDQMPRYVTLNEQLVRQIAAIECHLGQFQIALSISPTTGPHERLGNTFHCGVLFDSYSEYV